jgi:hypothetical protein
VPACFIIVALVSRPTCTLKQTWDADNPFYLAKKRLSVKLIEGRLYVYFVGKDKANNASSLAVNEAPRIAFGCSDKPRNDCGAT